MSGAGLGTGAGSGAGRPRVLVIAEAANPEWTSVPLVGWSLCRALGGVADVHAATHVRNAEAWRRAGVPESEWTAIDNEKVARLMWRVGQVLRGGKGKGWTTVMALAAVAYRAFEAEVWKVFGDRIGGGAFDVVHRVTPLSPTLPSAGLARRCRAAGVPFVLGPLNGGLPWPKGFDGVRRSEREWLSYFRGAYKLLPGYHATRRAASAVMIASRATMDDVEPAYRDKCVYLPENAVDPGRFSGLSDEAPRAREPGPLRVAFVGRLVPYKGCDMLLEAASGLLASGAVEVDVYGDGPERERLAAMVAGLPAGAAERVRLHGWVEHGGLADRLGGADVLGFPSIREFGGGVVLEAMALGVVPVIVDYGGPGELVTPGTGFAVPIGPRAAVVEGVRGALEALAADPGRLGPMAARCRARVRSSFTWSARAGHVAKVYEWVLGRSAKPDFGTPLADEPAAPGSGEPAAAGVGSAA